MELRLSSCSKHEALTDPAAANLLARKGFPHATRPILWAHFLDQLEAITPVEDDDTGYLVPVNLFSHIKEDASRCYARHVARAALNLRPPSSPITERIEGDPCNRSELVPLPDEKRYLRLCEVAFGRLIEARRSYSTVWTYLLMPLVVTFQDDEDVIRYFQKVAMLFRTDIKVLRKQIGQLVNKFRVVLPDLYCYMDEEDMDLNEMAESWMTSYLSREMMLPDALRLWDVYFAMQRGQSEYQIHVCLALLAMCNEALQELDKSEARSLALALPALDMDRLLSQADLIQRNLTSLD
ncbi:RabGAP/TBC [Cystobasidium minutum MCA 4210]|uniref:RabGAP/TBC n=1 Tax=Cystobasidium minutum MCA 4210 TaxID=1397322 RepID=UPI0034CE3412|eukprot:jgi/Rhomi1/198528/gm1.6742_g